MENVKMSRNLGLTHDIWDYIKQNPGKTTIEILAGMNALKVDGKPKYQHIRNSISSMVSQLVKKNLVHYKEGGLTPTGNPCFKVYPGKGVQALVGANMGSHLKKKRPSHKQPPTVQHVIPAVNSAQKVDVQLLIAIGDKDTMIGFDTARELYEQLQVIFNFK